MIMISRTERRVSHRHHRTKRHRGGLVKGIVPTCVWSTRFEFQQGREPTGVALFHAFMNFITELLPSSSILTRIADPPRDLRLRTVKMPNGKHHEPEANKCR